MALLRTLKRANYCFKRKKALRFPEGLFIKIFRLMTAVDAVNDCGECIVLQKVECVFSASA